MAEEGGNAPDCSCWFCRLPEKCCEWRNIRNSPAVNVVEEQNQHLGQEAEAEKKPA